MNQTTSGTGSLGFTDAAATMRVDGFGTVGIQVTGTFSGTITFEATVDGQTWASLNVGKTSDPTAITTTTTTGAFAGSVAGMTQVRARMSSYASGTAVVTFLAVGVSSGAAGAGAGGGGGAVTQSTSPWVIGGDVAHDAVDSGSPVKVGSKAITTLPTAVAAADRTNQISDVYGRPFTRHGAQGPSTAFWATNHAPAANTKATITKASAGAGIRNVCTGFTVALAGGATAPAAIQVSVALIDGATGGGTYLWGPQVIAIPAVAGALAGYSFTPLWAPGTAATAMTLEFSAAGGANTIESVSLMGTTVAE